MMDEATASIDYNTEKLLQEALKIVLADRTVITIAHRIKTIIDYDKILVLEEGKMIEFDSPAVLKGKTGSTFADLCEKSFL